MVLTHNVLAVTFGVLGNIISFIVFLAPVPTFVRICKKKSIEGFESLPYVSALFSAMLWIYYALQKDGAGFLLITINAVGCFIETIYIILFITYANKKARISTLKVLGLLNFLGFAAIILVCELLTKGSNREKVLGGICVGFSVCVFAAPLSIMLPNILGAFLGAVQMILYVIFKYYKTPLVVDETEKPKTVSDHSINMVKLSSTPASGDLTVQPQTNPDVSHPIKTHGGDLEDQMDKKMPN
ncbi:unnamed protein product [Arabidopsis thaliana]|uniref:Bidirectional sugar transporter SWEET n=1 Tax=Arabidopsis thaliana TaxID=3702 RepID=A0A7G2F295_ARATH|nr:unnamed protein product [Arabidopsis thaliana]